MNQKNSFSIKSTIEFKFEDPQVRDISYNSFMPEFKRLQTKRSRVFIEKRDNNFLIFRIESNDITAFRASMNEIISLGKIVDNTLRLTEKS